MACLESYSLCNWAGWPNPKKDFEDTQHTKTVLSSSCVDGRQEQRASGIGGCSRLLQKKRSGLGFVQSRVMTSLTSLKPLSSQEVTSPYKNQVAI